MATTGVDADGAPILGELGGDAAPLTSTAISITVDRYLDPRTPIRQAYCLRSDADGGQPATPLECIGGLGSRPTYDPVSRTLRIYLDAPLSPLTEYTLTVFAAADELAFGLRALDRVPLDEAVSVGFTTSDELPDRQLESPADRDPGLATCDEVSAAWFVSCQACHGGKTAPESLDLSKSGLPLAIDRVAHQASLGDQGSQAATAPIRFGVGMPTIASDNPGNSYLLYKVLARARYYPETLAEGELDRLQESIVGSPMPAHQNEVEFSADPDARSVEVSATLKQSKLQAISDWIAAGANCQPP